VLAQGVPPSVPKSYRALVDYRKVPYTTLHRAKGQRSIEEKAKSQEYLNPYEDKAVIDFLLQMSQAFTKPGYAHLYVLGMIRSP
ncbi:uncharacterized protein K441DRAFT_532005, partial [Cenococcum geophilum 1.58]|uniref:uncharacterized protein n=1 Tax=Cenococcum geophilum 1.58 TaxID=794803 RepID=UPI00358F13C9